MDDNKNQNQPNQAAADYQKILDEYAASVKPDTVQPSENSPEEKIPADSLKETISLPPEPKKITAENTEKTLADDLEEAISQKKPSKSDIPPQSSLKNIDTSKIEPPIHPSLAVNLEENDTIEQKPIVTPNSSIPKIEKPAVTVSEPIKTPITEIQNSEPEIPQPEKTPEEIKAEINRLLTDDETKPDTSNTATPIKKSSIGKVFFIFALILFLFVAAGLAYFLFLVPSNSNKNTTNSVPTSSITPTTAPVNSSDICELNDKTYQVGESFQSADGCNTCNCSSAGVITCTEKACTGTTTITPATSSANISTWKSYSNTKYNYSIKYSNKWSFREYPDTQSGAGFRLTSSKSDPINEFIDIDLKNRPSDMISIKFEDYVKKAISYETEGVYGDVNSIEKIVTDSNIIGYKVTWNYTDKSGKKAITLPITYFDTKNKQNDTIQISLLKEDYLTDYLKMIKTFSFN